jgi:VWFA-related protein
MALVVDDLGLSFGSVKAVRDSLRRFVDEQMQPGDLVAIVRTGGGMGALQQFTSDKRILYAAIEKIRFNLNGRVGVSSFEPIRPTMKQEINASMNAATGETRGNVNVDTGGTAGDVTGTDEDSVFDIGINEFREDAFTIGTLGAVNYVIRGMREMPGRKAVTLFSEGFSLMEQGSNFAGINSRIEGNLRRVTDLANRSSVVIYAIDPRGLVPIMFGAEDTRVGLRDDAFAQTQNLADRERDLFNSQQSLQYLSEETGGFAVINQNNLNRGVDKILNDQVGYYLLAYQPDDETFDPAKRRFNKLEIKLKRPDLKIRYRSGFFGVSDSDVRATPKTSEEQMLEAMLSPFASGQISLSSTSFFSTDGKKGLFMRSLIHFKGSDLKFVAEEDGWQKASFEVLAVTFGDNGQVIDTVNRVETIKAKDQGLQEIKEKGLVYSMLVPVKKPGAYQLRIAVRDTETRHIGSSSEFIEVPDLKKKRLVLSGIVMESSATREKQQKGEINAVQSDTQRDIAVRRFPAGATLMFGTSIYNAKNNPPRLTTQYRLFRDNRQIFTSPEAPLSFNGQADSQTIDVGGAFGTDKNFVPGNYILQVIVKDLSGRGKDHIATQWTDFEIVR